jgi:DNA-directed RNA polymerase subunit RPC12/RpoP
MAIATFDCPHCGSQLMTFDTVGSHSEYKEKIWVFFKCRKCKEIVTSLYKDTKNRGWDELDDPHRYEGYITEEGFELISSYNLPLISDPLKFLPPEIKRLYEQMMDAYKRHHWDPAGMLGRKIIDISTKQKLPHINTLETRINKLIEKNILHPDMGEWAHYIRLDGNKAAHDELFDVQTADQIVKFVDIFLIYFYQVQKMLEERRSKSSNIPKPLH